MSYDDRLQWLLKMARTPGWKAHARHRAQELAADKSGLWPDIDKRLQEAMRSDSPSPCEPDAGKTTASIGARKPVK